MSEKVIYLRCDWCESTYEGDEADAAAEGWFRLEHPGLEEPLDLCSTDCLISIL